MMAIYNSIFPIEEGIRKQTAGKKVSFFGSTDLVPSEVDLLLPSYFHWFGNSICNYCRLAGYVVARETGTLTDTDIQPEPARKKIKAACDGYVKTLEGFAEVLRWRNKVSAHFALTDPRNEDNIATLEASIVYPVGFDAGRFRTGTMISFKGYGQVTHESDIPNWSVTEVFETLASRFWPDVVFSRTDALQEHPARKF
jgi:hypothetical protein